MPNSLRKLNCCGNELLKLPKLPNSLIKIYINGNKLTIIPELPNSLKKLLCSHNELTSLPKLPDSLKILNCFKNPLSELPKLPNSLLYFYIDYDINLNKIEYDPDYKNINCSFYNTKIIIGDYIIESKEDYVSYMEDYEKYLFNKVKSARN